MNLNADTFWQYSLDIYGRPTVSENALALQDKHNVNVNMLLLLCWCLQNGAVITLNQWQVLLAAIEETEQKLSAHRQQRRLAKSAQPHDASAYEALKKQELALELEQQEALTTMFNRLNVEYVKLSGINGSIASFVNVFSLRQQPEAVSKITAIVKQL